MNHLTRRQQEVLELIKSHIDETGYPPTRADIAAALGFKSANAAEEHLKALARKGVIELIPGTSRGIKLMTTEGEEGIPIIGAIAAGRPILAIEHIEDYCALPADFFKPRADYLLRVRGDSMLEGGILDGDLLAVHKTQEVRNGDLVVARIEDEVTVKRFQKTSAKEVLLVPENRDYSPIHIDLSTQEFAIEGIGVGVIRH